MKKTLILLLSVMVVLAFAASAFALHQVTSSEFTPGLVKAGKAQIELGGEIRIRGDVKKNTSDFNEDTPDTTQKYDQRVRLRTKANVSDKTFGLVELETGTSGSTYQWGDHSNQKSEQLSIRQAYISHQFGNIGGIKAGHMLLALGNRLFFDHSNYGDDALLGWIVAGPGEVTLIDIKLAERTNATKEQMDDVDAYVVAVEMPINDQINVSGDITYIRDNSRTDNNVLTDETGFNDGINFINIGVRADADLKVVKVKGDIEFQTGSAKDITAAGDSNGDDVDFKGFATMIGVEGVVGPVTIRGGGAYGSGDDDPEDLDVDNFLTFLTDTQYSTFIYDYSVTGATGGTNQGVANTWYLTVGASMKPIPDLKISADAYYLQAVEDVALNGALDDEAGLPCDMTVKDNNCDKSSELGMEIDVKVEYQLTSNLVYFIEAGYLAAGEAYDRFEDGENEDADNPYRVRHGLLLTF